MLEDSDVEALADMYRSKHNLILNRDKLPRKSTITRNYTFEDSMFVRSRGGSAVQLHLKNPKDKSFTKYVTPNQGEEQLTIWRSGVNFLSERLPKIVYFPTFLFNFPDRIYLEQNGDKTNAYYTQVIQDVLDSHSEGLELQKHIIDRIVRMREKHPDTATFMAFLFAQDEKKQIDAVLQKASSEMSRVIFGSWNRILDRNVSGKRVQIDWSLDAERSNAPYLEVSIVDGESKFSLSERSLGFRWFFSFLLFTQFRRNRKKRPFDNFSV